jgi:glycerol-3-phosphate dehydrogenase (NAD(P)+)
VIKKSLSVAVVGAGAWGTALATVAGRAGHDVLLYSRNREIAELLNRARSHPRLPQAIFPPSLRVTATDADLQGRELWIFATPAQALRAAAAFFSARLESDVPAIVAAKGIEINTGKFMIDVLQEECPSVDPFILSGPSFAADVIAGKPTAVTLAGRDLSRVLDLAAALSSPAFRIYSSCDILGVQLGGAIKNVLAIACGISEGKGLGDSARAALTTRAFTEMLRFGDALGADRATLTGLSGLGDLILTCSSLQSRNFSFGIALGHDRSVSDLFPKNHATIEGIPTAKALMAISSRLSIELPVCEMVNGILERRLTVDDAIGKLLARPLRVE